MTIGVLALQGGFAAHQAQLDRLHVDHRQIRKPEQLQGLTGLIIPGGESSTLLKLMAGTDWLQALRIFAASKPVFGTCAGMILLARTVEPQQDSLQMIAMTVSRNAYGRQRDSFIAHTSDISTEFGQPTMELVFIRAPKVTALDETVEVLVRHKGEPVMVQQGHVLAASFHPELCEDLLVHRYFVQLCQQHEEQPHADLCLS